MKFRPAFVIAPLFRNSTRRSHIVNRQPHSMCFPRCTRSSTGRAAENSARLRSHVPQLETLRLRLRCAETRDFPAWAKIFGSADADKIGGPMNPERAWAGFCGYVAVR